ncbi:DNA internalization-related competence protein ComEC/Rec2 [Companilactobacillus ginsenosidimutans]|uniref:Metallo-beta-lactamase domain-containing protein n=1 Tax=Companilactobacillus ginsenosidimutans TaxID=1007676 RepID=A0A0H4QIH1_9LACO|nr:DNA internalization-related competence protein ComEC/Rec2 [Companilactobacillus ginsenosidimutans]AKP66448.1 hypothetical protein ABM34_02030 [Companilactobacillus ginsenosidimutans]
MSIFTALFALLFLNVRNHLDHPNQVNNVNQTIFYPDKIKVNGDLLSGEVVEGDTSIRFLYKIPNESEKKFWQKLNTEVLGKIKIKDIKEIDGPRNPGEFDFKTFSNHHGVFYTATIDKIYQLQQFHPTSITENISHARIQFISYLSSLPKWLKIHAQSLLVGYSRTDESDLFKTLSVLGVIHLFSLSGLHVLILVIIFKKLFSVLRITSEAADWLLLLTLPVYGIFVGLKTGITRAIILTLVSIVLKKFGFKMSSLDVFSITVLICLLINPFALVEMGGQLSFILSGALLYLSKSNLLVSTFKMNLLSLPIICFYTFQFSWLVLLMNIIFVPIFMYLILPTAIISAIIPNNIGIFGEKLNGLFDLIYSFMNQIAKDDRFNFVVGKIPVLIVLVLVILALFNIENKLVLNEFVNYFMILLIASIMYVKFPIFGTVSIIDVGQGDSILITTPFNRKSILVDTAGKLDFPVKPWQEKKVTNQVEKSTIPYLKYLGVSKLNIVMLSHKDVDHIGNLYTLLQSFPVDEVRFGSGLEQNARIKRTIHNNFNVKFTSVKRGDKFNFGSSTWEVLWPKQRSVGENGDSLTLLATMGKYKWLFTGDLDIENEEKILKLGTFHADYLKAGHHGSKTSTGSNWLKAVNPKLALISAGINNRYGHPNKETIQRLDDQHVAHLNTAEYGMITWYYYPFNQSEGLNTFVRVK